jgi:MFS family permease
MSLETETGETEQLPAEAETYPADWKRNFAANFIDVAFFSFGLAFASLTTIVPLYIRALGGSTLLVGLAPALVQTGLVLPPLFVAPFVSRLKRKLPYILVMTLGERIPWVILALVTWLFAAEYPGILLVVLVLCLACFGLGGGITLPAWMDLVANVTPLKMRGKLFGYSGAVGGLLGVLGGLFAERVLADYAFPINYTLCFTATAICMVISYVALASIRETERKSVTKAVSIREYIRRLPPLLRADRDFSAFLGARMLTAFGNMGVGFVSLYAAAERGIPESTAGIFTSCMLGAQMVSTPIWGLIGDRHGHKGALQFGLLCNAVAMAMAIFTTAPAGFYVIFALLGMSSGVLFTTTLNMVVEFADEASRVTYIGLHGTLIAPATMLAPLIGGWLAAVAGFGTLFVVATICSGLALAVLTFGVRDPRSRQVAAVTVAEG